MFPRPREDDPQSWVSENLEIATTSKTPREGSNECQFSNKNCYTTDHWRWEARRHAPLFVAKLFDQKLKLQIALAKVVEGTKADWVLGSQRPVPLSTKKEEHNELHCRLPPGCVSWDENDCLEIVIYSKPSKTFSPQTVRAAPVAPSRKKIEIQHQRQQQATKAAAAQAAQQAAAPPPAAAQQAAAKQQVPALRCLSTPPASRRESLTVFAQMFSALGDDEVNLAVHKLFGKQSTAPT